MFGLKTEKKEALEQIWVLTLMLQILTVLHYISKIEKQKKKSGLKTLVLVDTSLVLNAE